MKKRLLLTPSTVVLLCIFTQFIAPLTNAQPVLNANTESLTDIVTRLDGEVFDSFNRCKDPVQLQKHGNYFAADVEFYHDNGGVTWSREAMLTNTEKYACGNYRRELVTGSLKVYPIKDFGAIAQGTHRFCQSASGKCEGMAEFTFVWRNQSGNWQITRALSYGHRANDEDARK